MFVTPVVVYPVGNKDSSGDRMIEEPFTLYGYVYDENQVVTNNMGEKEISTRQIYLPKEEITKVDSTSLVSCLTTKKSRIIIRQEYRGRHGKTYMGVLYLP